MRNIRLKQKITLILFGLFLCIILLELGLRLGGWVFLSIQEHKNRISLERKGAYRILCLGGSTTAAQWPGPLEEILNQQEIGIKFSVIDKGIPSVNTTYILLELEENINKYNPDMVITMMGINDRGSILPYDSTFVDTSKSFLKNLRIYKFVNLFCLYILNKGRGMKLHRPQEEKEDFTAQIDYSTQLNSLKKAIELDPSSVEAYREFGLKKEETLKKAIELDPSNVEVYIELGRRYRMIQRFSDAEAMLKKAIELDPSSAEAYREFGKYYQHIDRFSDAEAMLKKAIELDPSSVEAYREFGWYYHHIDRFSDAEAMFKKAIELDPSNVETYIELGRCYRMIQRFSDAEAMFKKAMGIDPDERTYGCMALLYEEQGEYDLAEEYAKKSNAIRLNYYNFMTNQNYQSLKNILTQRGIKLACVQYPMLNIGLLKKIFNSEEEIIFVDNERVFKEALRKEGYDEYFIDMFAGSFGHCTEKGNRLLAENIANAILKEVFGK